MNRKALFLFLFFFATTVTYSQIKNPIDTSIVLLFNSGQFELDSISKNTLEHAYKQLIKNDIYYFYVLNISGYTDDKGSDSSNYILSQKRAITVGKYLTELSKDTVIMKTGMIDYMTQCHGVKVDTIKYQVPIGYEFFGDRYIKYHKVDSLNIDRERKVILNFKDNRGACLGTFDICKLPSANSVFKRDSTILIYVLAGYLDQYTTGHGLPTCKYDSTTRLSFMFIDSLPTHDIFCEKIANSFESKQNKQETKIGSLSFGAFLNDTLIPNPVCKSDFYKAHKIRIQFSEKLILCQNFILYTDKHELLEYQIKDGFIETYIDLNASQSIEVFIKNTPYKKSNLRIKSRKNISVSTMEPISSCEIASRQESKGILFWKHTNYPIFKFSKNPTIIYINDNDTNHKISCNLKDIKYKKSKSTYILDKQALKILQSQQKQM